MQVINKDNWENPWKVKRITTSQFHLWPMCAGKIAGGACCLSATKGNYNTLKIGNSSFLCIIKLTNLYYHFTYVKIYHFKQVNIRMEQERINKRRTLPSNFWDYSASYFSVWSIVVNAKHELATSFPEVGPWWIPHSLWPARAIFHGGEISGHPVSAPVGVVHWHQSFSVGSSKCTHTCILKSVRLIVFHNWPNIKLLISHNLSFVVKL